MTEPRHARIGFYTARPGDLDHVIERARDEVIPMLELEPGFRRYVIVRAEPNMLVSLTGWDTHEQAQLAARRLSAWVAEVMGTTLGAVENHVAEVSLYNEANADAPAFARFSHFAFKSGRMDDVRRKVEAEYVPLLREQDGFVRYAVFATGPDSVITYSAFASHAQAEVATAATRAWADANIAADIVSVTRHAGDVVWSIRKDA